MNRVFLRQWNNDDANVNVKDFMNIPGMLDAVQTLQGKYTNGHDFQIHPGFLWKGKHCVNRARFAATTAEKTTEV